MSVLRWRAELGGLTVLRQLPVLRRLAERRLSVGRLTVRWLTLWWLAGAGLGAGLRAVLRRSRLTVVRTLSRRGAVRRGLGFVGHMGKCEACRFQEASSRMGRGVIAPCGREPYTWHSGTQSARHRVPDKDRGRR